MWRVSFDERIHWRDQIQVTHVGPDLEIGCVLSRGEAERMGISSRDASGLGRRRSRAGKQFAA